MFRTDKFKKSDYFLGACSLGTKEDKSYAEGFFQGCKIFSIIGILFLIYIFVASGYNTYQNKYSISIEKFEQEFVLKNAQLSGGKRQHVVLTGSNSNGIITLSVDEIPVNKTKFIVVYETFKQPNGKEFTTQTFGGYR